MEHLIPDSWFVGMHWFPLAAIAGASIIVLMVGADWLVKGASGLAVELGMSKIIVGATIVSLGTTTPECAVSVMAAWSGQPGLALGNAVGSIIADTGLIFGLGCLLVALPADRFLLERQGWVQFGSASLLAAICYVLFFLHGEEAALPRWVGGLFIGLLAVYLIVSVRWSRQHPGGTDLTHEVDEILESARTGVGPGESDAPSRVPHAVQMLGWILLGLLVVLVSSRLVIVSVSEFAMQVGVPEVVISATLVALGTSLPELVVGLTSIRRGHPELLVGNVIGADVLNVLFVIGASALATPLAVVDSASRIPAIFLYLHLPTMMCVLLLFRGFIYVAIRNGSFSRWMGWPLVLIYFGFIAASFVLG